MKNLNTILISVLVVAVGVLYYLQFAGSGEDNVTKNEIAGVSQVQGVVFVNTDSLFANYEKYEELSTQYQSKAQSLEAEFQNRAQGLQREVANYQQTRSNLTIGQARAVEEDLVKKEQNLMQYQQSLQQQLLQEEADMINELYAGVTDYLKQYGGENDLQVVLTYSGANRNILFASDSLDITEAIVAGLNEQYQAGGMPEATPADTTATAN